MSQPNQTTFGRIDVHAHLISGVDDGCPSVADALHCAAALVDAGYTHAFCTPHIWPTLPHNNRQNIPHRTAELQQAVSQAGLALTLLPGGEWNLPWHWPALRNMPREEIITYAMAGRYLLFDFWADELPPTLQMAVDHLQAMDFTLILAHPERIGVFQRDPTALDALTRRGVLLQMNTWCLTEPAQTPTRQTAERLLLEDRYFCFGTDTHNARGIDARIAGLKLATDLVGEAAVDRLTSINPRRLIP